LRAISSCELLYVNPRPYSDAIDDAVQLGSHSFEDGSKLDVRAKRVALKERSNESVIRHLFKEELQQQQPLTWLDVGAGYGEFVGMMQRILPQASVAEGIEPMVHKATVAAGLNIPVRHGYLTEVSEQFDAVSLIDVFSHIPDFGSFLHDIRKVLRPNGSLLLKTGNVAEIGDRRNFPDPLNLPDHLVFGGAAQVTRFLTEAGFEVTAIESQRVDGIWYSVKNFIKWLIGRPVFLSLPYTSPTRTVWIRARVEGNE
jgi:cyclopropane fatty-acyl-phospholipid synthase-like methyltransferase